MSEAMNQAVAIQSVPIKNPIKQLKKTTCPYCGVGCGVDIEVELNPTSRLSVLTKLQGTPEHPANFGRLCVKGSKLLETNGLAGRLLHPEVAGKKVDWPTAIDTVASKFSDIIARHGPDAVAFYVSGQLLTEDYYVANKLMKGYIGSANIDTNSRLCMSSAVAAYKRAFGADSVPCCYEDLEHTELLVLIGSNAAWTHPVLFQRMERAKQLNPNMRVVFVDPRRTASCELADLHLPIKAGTDVALFTGLLNYLVTQKATDQNYISQHTEGFEQTLKQAAYWSLPKVAEYCDIELTELERFYQLFMVSDKVVSFYSMGVNQSASGVDKANAIINCHLATGKIGKEGCGPFSITGQPNAMGGREVGGMANMLAAHMNIDDPQHRQWVQEYWQSPAIPSRQGLKAIDLFEKIEQGKVKAVWIMATNPVVSMPNRNKIEAALLKCEMVVVSDCVEKNDTLAFADVKFPATGWSEKDGTVTNSERRISRQRGILPPAGEAKPDWQIICEVAKAMGHTVAFNYQHPAQIFAEYAGLTAYQNNGSRDLDLSGLCALTAGEYDTLKPIQWPVNKSNPMGTKRLFTDNIFYTASGKAQFIAITPKIPEQSTSDEYPYVLNSGRIRDQWHTMTRTGNTAQLSSHIDQAFVAIHPADAENLQISEGDLIALNSAQSRAENHVVLPARFEPNQRKGELFTPIHWSRTWSSSASIASLYSDASDAISGQPELKHAAVAAEKVEFAAYGQIFSAQELSPTLLDSKLDYWMKSPLDNGFLYRFATHSSEFELTRWLQVNFPLLTEWMSVLSEQHQYLWALRNGKLALATFFATNRLEINSTWINELLTQDMLQPEQKVALLRAEPDQAFNQGRLVCSCFKVGENAIIDAISAGCKSVDQLGQSLKCGTNCGSCKSELSQLIRQHSHAKNMLDVRTIAMEAM
ncbi:MAG: assimilatory nitrate reductase catalytic subunit [Paraglaciecola sp.]|jgi:assimilatory nitrate reductase catalytic subunit